MSSDSTNTTTPVSISVSYNGKLVNEGDKMNPFQTIDQPRIFIDDSRSPGPTSYSVIMIDRNASRPFTTGPLLTYVHYWAVFSASNAASPARMVRTLAPYVQPAPHDLLLHKYEFLVYENSPFTTSPPANYLYNVGARYTTTLQNLISPLENPLGSTFFIEQL